MKRLPVDLQWNDEMSNKHSMSLKLSSHELTGRELIRYFLDPLKMFKALLLFCRAHNALKRISSQLNTRINRVQPHFKMSRATVLSCSRKQYCLCIPKIISEIYIIFRLFDI